MNAALEAGEVTDIPALITDMYYLHEHKLFQLQVFFNKNLVFNTLNQNVVESFAFHYTDFSKLFIDWLYCFECIKEERFDISKHHAERIYVKEAALFDCEKMKKTQRSFNGTDNTIWLLGQTQKKATWLL